MGLVALASIQLLAVSQDNGWQFSLVADHEGGRLRALSSDMKGMVREDDGGMELYAITVEGGRTRVRQTRQGPDRRAVHIVDLVSGKVVATAATAPWVLEVQFIPESDEVLFYEYGDLHRVGDLSRLNKWRYLEGEPAVCVNVDGPVAPLVVDSSKALVYRRSHERPLGRLDLETCALEWGAPIIEEGQGWLDDGRPRTAFDQRLLLPGRTRFAYVASSYPLEEKVVIRPVDNIDHELLRIEMTPAIPTATQIFATANYLGLYFAQRPLGEQVIPSRELRLYRLSDNTLERRVDIGSWDRTYTEARHETRLGTAVAGHPLQDIVAVATQSDPDNTRIRLYDLSDGREIRTLHFPPFKRDRRKPFNSVDITFLQFSADGRYLVAANRAPRIRVWEMVPAAIVQ